MSRPILFAFVLLAWGCSSTDDATGSGGASAADAASDVAADAAPDTAAETDPPDVTTDAAPDVATEASPEATPDAPTETSTDAPAPDALADVTNDIGPVSSCDELNSVDCFANNECDVASRCENVGTDSLPVACCVAGARGAGQAGESCVDENDCESGICIAGSGPYMCSTTCNTVDDCPADMKNCTFIAFSGSNDMWCLPTN